MDNHRKQLRKQYEDFAAFNARFEVPQQLIDDILRDGEKQNIKPQLKGLIARDLWDMSEYYAVINEQSETVQKALELLSAGEQ